MKSPEELKGEASPVKTENPETQGNPENGPAKPENGSAESKSSIGKNAGKAASKGVKMAGKGIQNMGNSLNNSASSAAAGLGAGGEDGLDSVNNDVSGSLGSAGNQVKGIGNAARRKGADMIQHSKLAKSTGELAKKAGVESGKKMAGEAAASGAKKLGKNSLKAGLKALKNAAIKAAAAMISFIITNLIVVGGALIAIVGIGLFVAWFMGMAGANDNKNADYLNNFYVRGNDRYEAQIENTWIGVYFMKYSAESIYATVSEPEGNDDDYSAQSFKDLTGRDKLKTPSGADAEGDKESVLYQQGTTEWADLNIAEAEKKDEELRVSSGALYVVNSAVNDGFAIPAQLIKPVYTNCTDKIGTDDFKVSGCSLTDENGNLLLDSAQSTKFDYDSTNKTYTKSEDENATESGTWDWGLGSYVHYQGYYQPSRITNYQINSVEVLCLPSNMDATGCTVEDVGKIVSVSSPSQDDLNAIQSSYSDDGSGGLIVPESEITYKDWKRAFDNYSAGNASADDMKYAPYNSTGVPNTEVKYLVDNALTFAGPITNLTTQSWEDQGATEGAQHYSVDVYLSPDEYEVHADTALNSGTGVTARKNIYKKGERLTFNGSADFDPTATFTWVERVPEVKTRMTFGEAKEKGLVTIVNNDSAGGECWLYIGGGTVPAHPSSKVLGTTEEYSASDTIPENLCPEDCKTVEQEAIGAHYESSTGISIWEDENDHTKDANKDDYTFGAHFMASDLSTKESGILQTYIPTYSDSSAFYENLNTDYLESYLKNYKVFVGKTSDDDAVGDVEWKKGKDYDGVIENTQVHYDLAANSSVDDSIGGDLMDYTLQGNSNAFFSNDVGDDKYKTYDWGFCYFKENEVFSTFYFDRMPNLQFYRIAGKLGYVSDDTERQNGLEVPSKTTINLAAIIGSNTDNDVYKIYFPVYSQTVKKYANMYGVDSQMIRMIMGADAAYLDEDQNPYSQSGMQSMSYPVTMIASGSYNAYNFTYRAVSNTFGNGTSSSASSKDGGGVTNIDSTTGIETFGYDAAVVGKTAQSGETIDIPNEYTSYNGTTAKYGSWIDYMNWDSITAEGSNQMKLVDTFGRNYDSDGIGTVNGRKTVAVTNLYGNVGDYIDIEFDSGEVMHAIIADIKSSSDHDYTAYGHKNGLGVLELITNWGRNNKVQSYRDTYDYDRVSSITNLGSVYGDAAGGSSSGTSTTTILSGAESSIKATAMYLQKWMGLYNYNVPMVLTAYHLNMMGEKYGWTGTNHLGDTYIDAVLKYTEIAEGMDPDVAKTNTTYNDWLQYMNYTNQNLSDCGITPDMFDSSEIDFSEDTLKTWFDKECQYALDALSNYQGNSIKTITVNESDSSIHTFKYWNVADVKTTVVTSTTDEGLKNMSQITSSFRKVSNGTGVIPESIWKDITLGRADVDSGVYVKDGKFDVRSTYEDGALTAIEPKLLDSAIETTIKKMITVGTNQNYLMIDSESSDFWKSRFASIFGDKAAGTNMNSAISLESIFGTEGAKSLSSIFKDQVYSVVKSFGTHPNENGVIEKNDGTVLQSSAKAKTDVLALMSGTITSVLKGEDGKGSITLSMTSDTGREVQVTYRNLQTAENPAGQDPNPFTTYYNAYKSENEEERQKLSINAGDTIGYTQDDGTVEVEFKVDNSLANFVDVDSRISANGSSSHSNKVGAVGSIIDGVWTPTYDLSDPYIQRAYSGYLGYLGFTNCTFTCAVMAYDILGVQLPTNLHNGRDWYANAIAQGYEGGSTPEPGAIICWGANPNNSLYGYGHVAFVLSVFDDGSILVGEGGSGYGGYHEQVYTDYQINDAGQPFQGFIYLKDLATK